MPDYDTQLIRCRRCGNTFSWTAGEQRYFYARGLEKPKDCADCRSRRKDYFRSSQVDHPAYPAATPPPLAPHKPARQQMPPPAEPDAGKRPFWWANPLNRNTVALGVLGLFALVVFILLLLVVF